MNLTRHAAARAKQRGLTTDALEALLDFGVEQHDGHGTITRVLTARAIARLRLSRGDAESRRVERLRGAYLVEAVDTGDILTCGWRSRRLTRG